jgi:YegS/Rv2252/BmrU family lipid kinase
MTPPDRRGILIIYNPAAGQSRRGRLDAVIAELQSAGAAPRLLPTMRAGDAESFARAATQGGVDLVLAAGGDGTINEVANGLAGSSLPMAICPLGTANVLAAEIGLPICARAIVAAALHGPIVPICLGRANDRRFLMMVGAGFDAQVVAGVNPWLKRRLGKGAYMLEVLRQIGRYSFPRLRVVIDGAAFTAASVVIAKGRLYGGAHLLAPKANLTEPDFQICLFQSSGPWAVLRYGLALLLGRLPARADLRQIAGRNVRVEGPSGDPVQGDGELIARLPLDVAIAPERLNLVMPV